MTNSQPAFTYAHTIETDVPAARIWALYEDFSTWPRWDRQAGQDPLPYRLVKVEPGREFVDETPAGGLVIRVSHLLEPAGGRRLRITHAAQIFGPAGPAQEVGPLITADFPETMASLVALAAGSA